ncbi:hypothetical protein F5I97DRAFT_1829593 [Phlebopus sp. FC_14]|nr:hypothetical protein F5I97DRAFT_1829593 [Phlebopus sp. FC_14]
MPAFPRLRGLNLNPFEAKAPVMPMPVYNGDRVHVIVIFGRTGMGVSSLVNLITGREDAPYHTDIHPCTQEPAAYRVEINEETFDIYDIPGFGSGFHPEKTISDLYAERGIDLLINCMRPKGGVVKGYYNAVRSAVPERVPIVAVVTGLEKQKDEMEDWWSGPKKNGENLAAKGMRFVDHACVTSLPREDVCYNIDSYERRYHSVQAVRNLIWRNCNSSKRLTYVRGAGHHLDLSFLK